MTMTETEPIMVDDYAVTVEDAPRWDTRGGRRNLRIVADYEDSISVNEKHWPALVSALEQLGVIPLDEQKEA